MGSPLRLSLVGVDEPRASAAWARVSDTIEDLEQALSRFRPSADLVALNGRAGDPACAPVHPRLYDALAAAERAWRRTGGAFDPRVLGDLERLGYRGAEPAGPRPSDGRGNPAAARAAAFPDGRWLRRDPRSRSVAIAAPVDLGWIGKGLALRWAFAVLGAAVPGLEDGAAGALLEAGGDLIARGPAPQPGPWLIGIESPWSREVAVLELAGAPSALVDRRPRLATDDGRPSTTCWTRDRRPAARPGSVTVADADPAWAEIWSKTLFLEGSRGIGPRARGMGLAAWWIRDDGGLEMTPAARVRTAWSAAEA
jgi:thiamine biosynthesis lipoprotein